MSTPFEILALVGGLLASFTVCAVKLVHQIQNSKCTRTRSCGAECIRDVQVDLPEVETQSATPHGASPTGGGVVSPPPPSDRVRELRRVFDGKVS